MTTTPRTGASGRRNIGHRDIEHGIDSFVFGPSDDPVRQVQVFAAEVAPAVREAVARHRQTPDPA
jgi:hypothetical protein